MKKHVFICALVSLIYCVSGQDECVTPDGGIGICKPIAECSEVVSMVNSYRQASVSEKHSIKRDLRVRSCDPASTKVCCGECKTPRNETGIVKYIRECQYVLDMVSEDINYVKQSIVDPIAKTVCCKKRPTKPQMLEFCDRAMASPPDPKSRCCGVESLSLEHITGGETSAPEAFPWTVLFEYKRRGETILGCGGTLISNHHVITAAHCINGKRAWPPSNVRVGEFDSSNDGPDCVSLQDGNQKCTPGAEIIPVASYVVHPDYDVETAANDIAIIKLKTQVKYTDYIRPICLPTSDMTGEKMTVVGWGKVDDNGPMSKYKMKVDINEFDHEKCKERYSARRNITDSQICAGGEDRRDSCSGDSGNGMMKMANAQFHLIGVVSFGPKPCGTRGSPGVYTRVYKYLDWINDNLD